MVTKTFTHVLSYEGNDILHERLEFKSNVLVKFSLNYTTTISGNDHEVIRFDTSHGYLHVHKFYQKPVHQYEIKDKDISIRTVNELVDEIKQNWEIWKKALIKNYELG